MAQEFDKETVELARFAKALGHPARVRIIKFLLQCRCCFTGDIVEILPLAQSTVSQHLKELKDSGLIQGEINPPRVKYCINWKQFRKAQRLFDAFFSMEDKDD